MSDLMVVLLSVIVFPIMIGWIRGKNNVDPYTIRGLNYYDSNPEK